MLARYLEGGEITTEELKQGLREGVVAGKIFPVLYASGLRCAGIQLLLDAIVDYLPSPADRPAVAAVNAKTHEAVERRPDPAEPFSARVFKTVESPTGKLSVFVVYSGKVDSDSVVANATRDTKERLGRCFILMVKQQPIASALPGEIVAVGLKKHILGTPCVMRKRPVVFPPLHRVRSVISCPGPEVSGMEEKRSCRRCIIGREDQL